MTPLAPHLTAFLLERLPRERRASVHTCDAYAYAFQLLLAFAAKRLRTQPSALALEQFDVPLVLAFLDDLESTRGNSARTRNARLVAIKSFARFVEYRAPSCLQQVHSLLAILSKKTDERLVAYLTRDEMQAVLDAPDPRTRDGVRDRAMLHLAFAAGLRVSELVGLRLDEVALQPQPTIHVMGKGRRERLLPLWKTTAKALRAWLAVRGNASCPELFLNARGGSLTRDGFEYILAKHVATATLRAPSLKRKRVSPHVLRHSCAMHTLEATHDIRKVALWLGHASVQTTEIYLRAARGPLSLERLSQLPDGRLAYRMKRPSASGATSLEFTPVDFLRRVAALIPPPRVNLVRFYGVLSGHARLRPLVVPPPPELPRAPAPASTPLPPSTVMGDDKPALGSAEGLPPAAPARPSARIPWARLLQRTWGADLLTCGKCGGKRRVVACVFSTLVTAEILAHLGLPAHPLALAPARDPPQGELYG